ncbi:MAG: Ig-like domain-containing protein [Bacteroidota bacterium]
MIRRRLASTSLLLVISVVAYLISVSCANRGNGPQGGPKDIMPPRPQKSIPDANSLNYKKNRIDIIFDEIVQVQNTFDNIIISPPQKQAPTVKAIGKKISVELQDTLKDETTYTIFFGDAIVDNNEHNVLSGYSFSFATGESIDTLKMSGTLIDAATLNPIAGVMVGIHSDLSDSAFISKPFDRITKTDKNGNFSITNVRSGKYRIYALDDVGNNYRFDMPDEKIAFSDSIFEPSVSTNVVADTVYRDSVVRLSTGKADTLRLVDTVIRKFDVRYSPDSIVLRAFVEDYYNQYVVKSLCPDVRHFTIYFNAPNKELPRTEGINFDMGKGVVVEPNSRGDTIDYWLKDTALWAIDTLKLRLTYMKMDSTHNLVEQTDTISLRSQKRRAKSDKNRNQEFLTLISNAKGSINYFDTIEISIPTPAEMDMVKKISLQRRVDTIWQPQKSTITAIDSVGRRYRVAATLQPSQTYRMVVDSAYFRDIYGNVNKNTTFDFTVKSKDVYASLTLEMGVFTGKEIIELIDKNERVIRRAIADKQKVRFDNLDAGTYYARLFVDLNGNGKYDVGNFAEKRQAEPVYYYSKSFELRQMWDNEEYWNYRELPILRQKPQEIKKVIERKK